MTNESLDQIVIHLKSLEARVDALERAKTVTRAPRAASTGSARQPLAERNIAYLPGNVWREYGHLKGTKFADAPEAFLYAYADALEEGMENSKYPQLDKQNATEARIIAAGASPF